LSFNNFLQIFNFEEKNLTSESLKNLLDSLISDNMQRFEIEKNAKAMAITNARERIADIILSLVK